jgi:hypothetical protein
VLGRELESLIMKLHRFLHIACATALLAAAIPSFAATSLLTPDGVRYAIEPTPETAQVEIARSEGYKRARLVVPSTQDVASEYEAQIAYDTATGLLFVVWSREGFTGSEIRYAILNGDGQWSTPRLITAGSAAYRGLQFVLTHSPDDGATLLHAAWWSLNGARADAEYGLFAFSGMYLLSGDVQELESLAAADQNIHTTEYEETGNPVHPPLAMARNEEDVDVAFGSRGSTALTRINITARKIGPDVRIWKPVGRSIERTPRANLVVEDTSSVVNGFIRNGRLALYTMSDDFRFVVLQNDGTWSPVREVHIDDDNKAADLLRELKRAVEELSDTDPAGSDPADH